MIMNSIENEFDYKKAIEYIEKIMSVDENTPEFEELKRLVYLVDKYEEVVYPINFSKGE